MKSSDMLEQSQPAGGRGGGVQWVGMELSQFGASDRGLAALLVF